MLKLEQIKNKYLMKNDFRLLTVFCCSFSPQKGLIQCFSSSNSYQNIIVPFNSQNKYTQCQPKHTRCNSSLLVFILKYGSVLEFQQIL